MNDFSKLPQYVSHKVVRAAKIFAAERDADGCWNLAIDGSLELVKLDAEQSARCKFTEDDLGYLVVYADGYVSWSPSKAFIEGYSPYNRPPATQRELDS